MLIKICCISSIEEAEMALAEKVDALGLVSSMPSGPGVIPEHQIAQIAAFVGHRARTVLLTSLSDVRTIADQYERCGVNAVQLCRWLSDPVRAKLRKRLAGAFIIQVVHVNGSAAIQMSRDAQPHVDALLLDSGTPVGPTVELGGTGRTHDWEISRRIRVESRVPVFLAGGLTADNVVRALEAVSPSGVDICSGVRTDGALDPGKLTRFVSAARAGEP